MKLAITGCNGRVGRRVTALALKRGHTIVGIDCVSGQDAEATVNPRFVFVRADLKDYEVALKVLDGCEGVIHLAALPDPGDYGAIVHNSNVVLSWNVLRACAELGISRIAQASSVNVITLIFSSTPHFEYFPIDEMHPCQPDEPYGLSKVWAPSRDSAVTAKEMTFHRICELQADTIVRRYPSMRVASLRLHESIPHRFHVRRASMDSAKMQLWGYVQEDSAADAFLLAVTGEDGKWAGHEAFFIVAPVIAFEEDAGALRQRHWGEVPVREGKDVSGSRGFFDCGKAERLLGWMHKDMV